MKKYWNIFLVLITLLLTQSSCSAQSWRRGVTFYEGDKSSYEIAQQSQLISDKIQEYESRIRRLNQERANIIARSDMIFVRNLRSTEFQIDNLQKSIDRLSRESRQNPDDLLSELEKLDQQLAQEEAKLVGIKESAEYPINLKNIDVEIESLQFNIANLRSAHDNMLVVMSNTDRTSYFAGNIRNGYEAASAYLLMKWANESGSVSPGFSTGTQTSTQNSEFTIFVRNDWVRPVTANIRHSSGWRTGIYLKPKEEIVISVPLPGIYSCYFQHGNRIGNTTTNTIDPLSHVMVEGQKYNLLFIQNNW